MKTKNVLVVAALLISGLLNVNGVSAHDAQQKSDNVTLNIKLKPIQTITVNAGHKNVDIVYSSIDDYQNGVTSALQEEHLTVFSTGGFTVSVKSDGDFKSTNGESIDAKDVNISATKGKGGNSGVVLSEGGAILISSESGGRELKYDVSYDNTAGSNDKYIDKYIAEDGTESVYTATVTYTIAAK